jgi:hypothetical protein
MRVWWFGRCRSPTRRRAYGQRRNGAKTERSIQATQKGRLFICQWFPLHTSYLIRAWFPVRRVDSPLVDKYTLLHLLCNNSPLVHIVDVAMIFPVYMVGHASWLWFTFLSICIIRAWNPTRARGMWTPQCHATRYVPKRSARSFAWRCTAPVSRHSPNITTVLQNPDCQAEIKITGARPSVPRIS